MRSAKEFRKVQRLIAAGLNDCAPRRTVQVWRSRPPKWDREHPREPVLASTTSATFLPTITATYLASTSEMDASRGAQ
jgi:hypothetical protein